MPALMTCHSDTTVTFVVVEIVFGPCLHSTRRHKGGMARSGRSDKSRAVDDVRHSPHQRACHGLPRLPHSSQQAVAKRRPPINHPTHRHIFSPLYAEHARRMLMGM